MSPSVSPPAFSQNSAAQGILRTRFSNAKNLGRSGDSLHFLSQPSSLLQGAPSPSSSRCSQPRSLPPSLSIGDQPDDVTPGKVTLASARLSTACRFRAMPVPFVRGRVRGNCMSPRTASHTGSTQSLGATAPQRKQAAPSACLPPSPQSHSTNAS